MLLEEQGPPSSGCPSLPWACPLRMLLWEAPPPGRGLATRSPVDEIQVVQVIQRVQHLAQHVLQPLGRKRRQDGGPESARPSQAARGRSVQPMGSGPFPPWVQMGLKPVADSSEPVRELLLQAAWGPSGQQDLVSCKALGSSPTLLSLGSYSTCTLPLEGTRDAECSLLTWTSLPRSLA